MSAPLSPLLEAAAARVADAGNRPAAAAALARLLAAGLPTRRDEDWRYLQLAPLAVFTAKLRIAQSLTASVPSSIASVSRFGLATLPQSR